MADRAKDYEQALRDILIELEKFPPDIARPWLEWQNIIAIIENVLGVVASCDTRDEIGAG